MRVSKHRSLSFGLGFLALLALVIATSASAFATAPGGVVTAVITGGSLTLTGANTTVNPLTLNGTNQSLTINMPMTVDDATGSGAGWHVSINATLFTDGTNTLANNMTISGVTSAASAGATGGTDPTNAAVYPLLVTTTAQTMFNAAVGTGLGSFNLTPTTGVPVPPTTVPSTYTSTITLALSTAP